MKNVPFCTIIIVLFISILVSMGYSYDKVHNSNYAQVETPIAINPTNPDNLIGATINIDYPTDSWVGVFYTDNGGTSWTGIDQLSTEGAADPVIAFDRDGVAYLLYQNRSEDPHKLYLKKSYDGGVNWTSSVAVVTAPNLDRPWMAISPIRNSEGFFNIYISFTFIDPLDDTYNIKVYESTDGGDNFTLKKTIPGTDLIRKHGSSIGVGPDGKILLAYADLDFPGSAGVIEIHVEVYHPDFSLLDAYSTDEVVQIGDRGGNAYYVKNDKVKADCYPRLAVDNDSLSAGMGNVYVTFASRPPQTPTELSNVYLVRGIYNNGSYNWSKGSIEATSSLHWMPAVSVSPDGVLSVLYYTSSDNTQETPIKVKVKISEDFGANWTNSHILNGDGFLIQQGTEKTFLGDYHGLTSWYETIYGLWCENKDHSQYHNRQAYWGNQSIPRQSLPANHVQVSVDQVDKSSNSFEKVNRWNQNKFTSYKAPYEWFIFEENGSVKSFMKKRGERTDNHNDILDCDK